MNKNRTPLDVILLMSTLLLIGTLSAQDSFAQGRKPAETQTDQKKENGLEENSIERAFMRGTEIQGTIEKPHVVYIVPWKEENEPSKGEIVLDRSFKAEILEPIEYGRFRKQWGEKSRD